jgi:hypothetical protein
MHAVSANCFTTNRQIQMSDPSSPRPNDAVTRYPRPDRSGYRLNLVAESEGEWLDLGWNEGVLSDGRPFRMEVWTLTGMTGAHFFFSTLDLDDLTSDSCCDLLEREHLVQFSPTSRRVKLTRGFDTIGQSVWAVMALFGDANGRYANPQIGMLPYAQPE